MEPELDLMISVFSSKIDSKDFNKFTKGKTPWSISTDVGLNSQYSY